MMQKELTRETILETLGVLALACLVVAHLVKRPGLKAGFLAAAVILLAIGLFVKPVARWIAIGWLKFGAVLGGVNSKIILGLIFYLFLTPIALLARMTRGDFLNLRKKAGADRTYWEKRDHTYTAGDLEKLW